MANSRKSKGRKPWEELDDGLTEEHVRCVPEEEINAIDDALGLQMISIRLQRSLLSNLKAIAEHHGIGYQPLIRDLLNRFAKSEMRSILMEKLDAIQEETEGQVRMEAVDDFLERERKQA